MYYKIKEYSIYNLNIIETYMATCGRFMAYFYQLQLEMALEVYSSQEASWWDQNDWSF